MKNKSTELLKSLDDVRVENDFNQRLKCATRGKHMARKHQVALAPDVAAAFPDEQAVNEALRMVLQLSKIPAGQTA